MSDLSLSELPSGGRSEQRHRRHRHRRRRRRSALVMLVCCVVFAGAAWLVWGFVGPVVDGFRAAKDYPGPGSGEVTVQIQAGDTGRAIGRTLESAGVVLSADAFVAAARDEPRSAGLQPGTYQVQREMRAADALALLLDPASRMALRVQVREGLTADQTFTAIADGTGLGVDALRAAVTDPAVGLPAEAGGDPEGYLFPATYEFEPDVTAVQVLAAMVTRFQQAMASVGVPAEQQRTVLVKASIIEAEGQTAADKAKVATVIENRLDIGMRLQMDSTVNYATGKAGITTTSADRDSDSPYNTYKHTGLPPGPINSPGEDSLRAVLNPTPGTWLYFVAVNPDTGETRFATTPAEHQENVELFRRWLRENPS